MRAMDFGTLDRLDNQKVPSVNNTTIMSQIVERLIVSSSFKILKHYVLVTITFYTKIAEYSAILILNLHLKYLLSITPFSSHFVSYAPPCRIWGL